MLVLVKCGEPPIPSHPVPSRPIPSHPLSSACHYFTYQEPECLNFTHLEQTVTQRTAIEILIMTPTAQSSGHGML